MHQITGLMKVKGRSIKPLSYKRSGFGFFLGWVSIANKRPSCGVSTVTEAFGGKQVFPLPRRLWKPEGGFGELPGQHMLLYRGSSLFCFRNVTCVNFR